MHPDEVIAGLRRELERAPERAEEIKAEIERVEKLPRPATRPEEPTKTADLARDYLAALKVELRRAPERAKEVEAEIKRVEAGLSEKKAAPKRASKPEPSDEGADA